MRFAITLSFLFAMITGACSQVSNLKSRVAVKGKRAFKIYDKAGKETDYYSLIDTLSKYEFVLLGETHNDALIHWLHLEMVKDLFLQRNKKISIGVEFFERDDDLVLQEYFKGTYKEKKFLKEAHFWPNYRSDYRPILEFARKNNIKYYGTNIPRRYASVINKKGLNYVDSLSESAKEMIAPYPFPVDTNLSSYRKMFSMMKSHGGSWNMIYAQMAKDATMAWFSLKSYDPDKLFIHFQGSGHSDYFHGIFWYLKQYRPESKIVTVSVSAQEKFYQLADDKKGIADFIIVTPKNFTKTYRMGF